jgi:hypothetical protein
MRVWTFLRRFVPRRANDALKNRISIIQPAIGAFSITKTVPR